MYNDELTKKLAETAKQIMAGKTITEATSKKYEITDEVHPKNKKLHRIRALKDFGEVNVGDLGGWVESEKNLSQKGSCWIDVDAMVYDKAEVSGDVIIYGKARVYGNAKVSGNSEVGGNSEVYDNAQVSGKAIIYGNYDNISVKVYNNAIVTDKAKVNGSAQVYGNAKVYGNAELRMHSKVYDKAQVYGNAKLYAQAQVYGNAKVFGNTTVHSTSQVFGNASVSGRVALYFDTKVGGNKVLKSGIDEATDDKEAYQKFFNDTLKKYGVKSPSELKGDDKKKFFDEIDAGWKGDDEKPEKNESVELKDMKYTKQDALEDAWKEGGGKEKFSKLPREKQDDLISKYMKKAGYAKAKEAGTWYKESTEELEEAKIDLNKKVQNEKEFESYMKSFKGPDILAAVEELDSGAKPQKGTIGFFLSQEMSMKEETMKLDGRRREFREKIKKLAYAKAKKMIKDAEDEEEETVEE